MKKFWICLEGKIYRIHLENINSNLNTYSSIIVLCILFKYISQKTLCILGSICICGWHLILCLLLCIKITCSIYSSNLHGVMRLIVKCPLDSPSMNSFRFYLEFVLKKKIFSSLLEIKKILMEHSMKMNTKKLFNPIPNSNSISPNPLINLYLNSKIKSPIN